MYKKREKKEELYKFKGCKDCTKDCLWNGLVARKFNAERNSEKFICNSNKGGIK